MSDNLINAIYALIGAISMFILQIGWESKRNKQIKDELGKEKQANEIKDLKLQLHQLEKDLAEWKDKYYQTVQDLLDIKLEFQKALMSMEISRVNED
jgi:hypothetical protein